MLCRVIADFPSHRMVSIPTPVGNKFWIFSKSMGFRVHGALVHTHDYHQKPFKHSQEASRGNGSHQQSGVGGEPLEAPCEYQIGPKLKIYMKIMYSEHFLFFEIFWLFMIFGTLFSEKCPFLGNFDKNLFLPPSSTQITKSGSKFNLELFLELFCPYVLMMGAKIGFCQICPKMDIFH